MNDSPMFPDLDSSEKALQDWLQEVIASGRLLEVIAGQDSLSATLKSSEAADWWPSFPIDYLARLRALQAAHVVLSELNDLELVSTSARSISRTKRESLFVDLLYTVPEGSRFVAIEIKKDRSTARETATELLAYEHEILNHIPFASVNDILMVVVSREFSTLLDHAIAGLITWSRKRVLCLLAIETTEGTKLEIHIPKAWEAIGQKSLPATGLQIAHLCPYPHDGLDGDQVYEACETAINLMAREAERNGGSGFAMVVEDHLYPGLTGSPYSIIAGAVNPYSFLPDAQTEGLVSESSSAVAKFLLSKSKIEQMTQSWDWYSADDSAAKRYLTQFGSPEWEGFSDWDTFRDPSRWQTKGITSDRHLRPIRVEFWGVIGDYARDVVINTDRMRTFRPGFCKPGIDWRHPHLGIMILDEVSIPPVIENGQWTFESLFAFGIRMGRFAAIAATVADADDNQKRKLHAGLFWAEADIEAIATEVGLRYLAAKEIEQAPPTIPIGQYKTAAEVMGTVTAFANWFLEHFIGSSSPLLQHAFQTGLNIFSLFDIQFSGDEEEVAAVRKVAVQTARSWLLATSSAFQSGYVPAHNKEKLLRLIAAVIGSQVSIEDDPASFSSVIAGLDDSRLIDNLFCHIPAIVSTWHPQLAHTLAPLTAANKDWQFYKDEIRASRARGVKYPCVILGAGGQLGIGRLPDDFPAPRISDTEKEVLFVDNQTFAEFTTVVTWADLASGSVHSIRPRDTNN